MSVDGFLNKHKVITYTKESSNKKNHIDYEEFLEKLFSDLFVYQEYTEEEVLNITSNVDNTQYYLDIYQNFDIETISDVTANKCILDSLGNPISDISNIQIDFSEVNDWILNELNKNPTDLYQLSSRRFEEIIAEIFIRKGYDVELTPKTCDGGKDIYVAHKADGAAVWFVDHGGKDIYVAHKDDLGSFLYLVECKKYDFTRKVGVGVVRNLYGVLSKEKATYGIVVTTSDFTKPAQEFQQDIKFQMSLKNFNSIQKWLYDVT